MAPSKSKQAIRAAVTDPNAMVKAIAALPGVYRAEVDEERCGYPTHGFVAAANGITCGADQDSIVHKTAEECGCQDRGAPSTSAAEHHEFTMVGGTYTIRVEVQ